jgi:hypothetical protein
MKTSVLRNILHFSPLKVNRRFGASCLLHPQKQTNLKPHVPPKRRLTFNGLHSVVVQKIRVEFIIVT